MNGKQPGDSYDPFVLLKTTAQIPAEQIHAALAMHGDTVRAALNEGVRRAVEQSVQTIIDEAIKEATKAINNSVSHYFGYGDGAKEIRTALIPMLGKVMQVILKEQVKDRS